MKLERYKSYRDSEEDWFDSIPSNWNVTHLKRLSKKITDGAHTSPDTSANDYPFLSVVDLKENKLDFTNCLFTSKTDYEQLVLNGCKPKANDVLFSKDGTIGETVVINEDKEFVVGSSFIIISPNMQKINSNFLNYLLSSPTMKYQSRCNVKGIGLPRISIFNTAKMFITYPDVKVQVIIANYLDIKTSKIDQELSILEQKVEKYKELKQTIIAETVLRGLDKNVELKSSEIEWIGNIPIHWKIKKIKDLFTVGRGRVISQMELDDYGLYPVYSSQTENDGCFGYINTFDYDKSLLTWTTDGVNAGTVFLRNGKFNCTNICGTLVLKSRFSLLNYMKYAVQISTKHNKRIDTNGAKIMNNEMKIIFVVEPPYEEQVQIASYLDEKTLKIDSIVEAIGKKIEVLKEFRKTLINDVVTGKVKVA